MKGFLSSFFGKKSSQRSPNYIRPKDIKKTSTSQPIQKIQPVFNNKPNILFMDDNFGVIELMKSDIEILSSLLGMKGDNEKHNPNGTFRFQSLYESLSEKELKFLSTFNPHQYNFYFATTNTCGLSVEQAIDNGLKVDSAILDIVLGGVFLEEDGSARIIDGIDIAKRIKDINKNAVFKLYTACTLGEYSDEAVKYRKFFKSNVLDNVILKNSDINNRRREILNLLMEVKNRCD